MIIDQERRYVIDFDNNQQEINRNLSNTSITQVNSFKNQVILRVGMIRDNIGYMLNHQNNNIIQNNNNNNINLGLN